MPMDDTGLVIVQIVQSFQDLLRPLLQRLDRNLPVFLPVLSQITGGTDLGDEIQSIVLIVAPKMIKRDRILAL